MTQEAGVGLYERAKELIPGGTQLLSKRPEMFLPERWPSYYQSAEGVTVTSLDGDKYVDMSIMGVGACVLGYADQDVNSRVHESVDRGSMCTLNAPEEVELAEVLIDMHPWADMVRYARTGGEAMAIAVRLARAHSGEEAIAFCGYHGWHDWYLAANLVEDDNLEGHLLPGLDPKGVPTSLRGTAYPFRYNDIEALRTIVTENDIGAIVMEPVRYEAPEDGFLEDVREIANEQDVPLVFDEITSGFRVAVGGVHERYDVTPDIVVYGKAMGNGYPIAAVLGREKIMDEAQESFISSTFWTERIGPVAALATIEKMQEHDVSSHLIRVGEDITEGWKRSAETHGLDLHTKGLPPLTTFVFEDDESQAMHTLFTQEMLNLDYLASNSVYASYSHSGPHVAKYLDAVNQAFRVIADAMENDAVHDRLVGPVAHQKFERLN